MSETINQNITVKELDELRLVGFRVLCSGDQYIVEIQKASSKLSKRIDEIKQVMNPREQFGASMVENETAEEDGYWVCVEVKDFEDIPSDMVTLTIPAQRYAVIAYHGPNHQIMDAYHDLHQWIGENSYVRRKNTWHIEKYHDWRDAEDLDVELFDTIG